MPPRTSPPMIASRLTTSPSTSPPLATRTCFAACTVPTTVPSIFTTPSAEMSPTIRIPVPMIDNPVTASPPAPPFSVNNAISGALLHERKRIERLAVAPNLEMQMGCGRPPRSARQGDHLPCLDVIAFRHDQAGSVSIHRLISRRMAQADEHAIVGVIPHFGNRPPARSPDRRAGRYGDVDPGVGFGHVPGTDLAPGHEAGDVERPVRRRGGPGLVARRRPGRRGADRVAPHADGDRKSTRLNSSHPSISYAVFCLKKKNVFQNPVGESRQIRSQTS